MSAMRHPWQGPGTLSQLTALCQLEQAQTIIIRFLVPARNDEVEATVTASNYNSYVLYLRTYTPTKNSTMSATRHPWQGPGTSSSCAVQC